jgi:hypothetical protein
MSIKRTSLRRQAAYKRALSVPGNGSGKRKTPNPSRSNCQSGQGNCFRFGELSLTVYTSLLQGLTHVLQGALIN